jgi:hypothetical protein
MAISVWFPRCRSAGDRLAVAQAVEHAAMLVPAPRSKEAEIVANLGEFPAITDPDEGRAFPSREHIPED